MIRRPALFTAVAAVLVGALAGCHSESATTPTPAPSPTPTPAPAPSPTPAAFVCPLPANSNPQFTCNSKGPRLGDQVNQAIDAVMEKHPELFNFNDLNGGSAKVLDGPRYYLELQKELGTQGVCTKIEEEEITIKNTNDFSEDWGVLTSTGYVRRRYRGTCTPAWW